jgi:hypothetical protein
MKGVDKNVRYVDNPAAYYTQYIHRLNEEKAAKKAVADDFLQSIQLSSHDDGWDSFPLSDNPYAAEGSRCLFGYSLMFLPAAVLFMAGDEFDADFVPLPTLSPYLFKKEKIGQGKWLY